MEGITVETLYEICKEQVKKGNGKKVVLISTDDEGNGYHTLYYGFQTKKSEIQIAADMGQLYDNKDPNNVVLLG